MFFPLMVYSQEIKITGIIKDIENRSIESASVVVYDNLENTLSYTYSDENGIYNLVFDKPNNNTIIISVASLGFSKKEITLDLTSKTNLSQSFVLNEKQEYLKEVIIETYQKIKINKDTTTLVST